MGFSYPYKKGYYGLGIRYMQTPKGEDKNLQKVDFLGVSANVGYKIKTIKRITIDPYFGLSVFPVVWNNRLRLDGRDYFLINFGIKMGFVRRRFSKVKRDPVHRNIDF